VLALAGRVTPDAIWQELNLRHRQIENAASGHDKRAEKAKLMLAYGSKHAQYLVQHGLMEDSSNTRPSAWGALLTTTATPSAADGAAATTIGVRKAGTGAGRTSVTGKLTALSNCIDMFIYQSSCSQQCAYAYCVLLQVAVLLQQVLIQQYLKQMRQSSSDVLSYYKLQTVSNGL
jgi:hypothetical protein